MIRRFEKMSFIAGLTQDSRGQDGSVPSDQHTVISRQEITRALIEVVATEMVRMIWKYPE